METKMLKNKIVYWFMAMMFGWMMIVTPASAAPTANPIALLQYIANNMINGLKTNKATLKTKPSVVYQLAYEYVVPYASLSEMSRRVLPPNVWNNATDDQRKQFQDLFTKTVIRTYASALSNYEDQSIRFFPLRTGPGNNIEVRSQIISSQREPINVTYRMIRTTGGWRLYDMSVEGVSMLGSFQAQFADILAQGNMATLLGKLSGHTAR